MPTGMHHSYTTHTVSLGGGGGTGERARWVGERGILDVVTYQGGGGGGACGYSR